MQYKNISFTVYDVGGQDKLRPLWRHYFTGSQGLIFVVDSNDGNRLELAALELHKILTDDAMREAVVLIFANKQDLPCAVKASEMTEKLGLTRLHHQWYIQPCSAIEGQGLFEGLDWLSRTLSQRK